jgi:flagellin-like hook-associated protein FlgL
VISAKSLSQTVLQTARAGQSAQTQTASAIERMSSGLKINQAKDSVSGLGISQELRRQTGGLSSSLRNAYDAASVAAVAGGASANISDLLVRMRQLTTSGANHSLSKSQRSAISAELVQLRNEINSVVDRTSYNGLSLLKGQTTQAIERLFNKSTGTVLAEDKALTAQSSLNIGATNLTDSTPGWSSVIELADVRAKSWSASEFTLRADQASLTLSYTKYGIERSQTLTLSDSSEYAAAGNVQLSRELNGITTLDFNQLGIQIDIKNNRIGSNHNAAEVATMVAGLGISADEDLIGTWTSVGGAAWDHGQTGNIKAVVTATDGTIKLTTTTGLSTVTGYSGSLTDGTATQIAFTGSQANVDAALASLKMNSSNGKGRIDVQVVPSDFSINTNEGVASYYQSVTTDTSTDWADARTDALSRTFDGHTGYLTNVTSTAEQSFIEDKALGWGWMGASDSSTEGSWTWVDGPEASQQFWLGQAAGSAVGGLYNNWGDGEPNEDRTAQWVTIDGADFDPGLPDATLKVYINASAGSNIRLLESGGLSSVDGYDDNWTNGTADEIVFTGSRAAISNALQTLQVYSATGTADVTVSFAPSRLSVNTVDGVTSFYEVIGSSTTELAPDPLDRPSMRKTWADAKAYAESATINIGGVSYTGYLANITSSNENIFLFQKLKFDSWIGATDAASEGTWVWSGGPEKDIALSYTNWNLATSEPNNSGGAVGPGEDYAEFYATGAGAGRWNDLDGSGALAFIIEYNDGDPRANPYTRTFNLDLTGEDDFGFIEQSGDWRDYAIAVSNYIVEYQGAEYVSDKRNKTILMGSPTTIGVSHQLAITSVDTSKADTGVYKLSANSDDRTATLNRYDIDATTLLATESVYSTASVDAGKSLTLAFNQLGVSVGFLNDSIEDIALDGDEAGFDVEQTVASSRTKDILGDAGLLFQVGEAALHSNETQIFRDLTFGGNADQRHGNALNATNELLDGLLSADDPGAEEFISLGASLDDAISIVNGVRAGYGAFQNRVEATIANLGHQLTGITEAAGQILDTDYAAEAAKLARMQIAQQASTAMQAQANQLPEVILSLLEEK